jgi:hypothetical protein
VYSLHETRDCEALERLAHRRPADAVCRRQGRLGRKAITRPILGPDGLSQLGHDGVRRAAHGVSSCLTIVVGR